VGGNAVGQQVCNEKGGMMGKYKFWLLAVLVLTGCNTDPATNVRQPMTVKPVPQAPAAQADGAIFHAESGRPLFEDRRARFVGDTITVNIVEKTSATKSTADTNNRASATNISVGTPKILGMMPGGNNNLGTANQNTLDTSFAAASSLKTNNADSGSNNNNFSGSITVTVLEIYPNGNLVVSGEKQVAVNNQTEFIRLSGVVNPINISSTNSVSSTQLADARIESKGKQSMDTAQIVSMMSRFFVALLPF